MMISDLFTQDEPDASAWHREELERRYAPSAQQGLAPLRQQSALAIENNLPH